MTIVRRVDLLLIDTGTDGIAADCIPYTGLRGTAELQAAKDLHAGRSPTIVLIANFWLHGCRLLALLVLSFGGVE